MKTRVFTVLTFAFLFCGVAQADLNDGLVAYYPFNGNADDASGNGNDGVVNGATLTTDRFGNVNRAYSFDGINSYIDVGNPIGDNPSIITQCAWILVLSPNGTIITKRQADDGSDWESMDVLSDYRVRFWLDDKNYNNNSSWALSAQYSDQHWHFVCGVRNGNSLKLYVDGNISATTSDSHVMSGSTYSMYIGHSVATGRHFTGKIDDVRIYSRAISESEIQELYTEGGGNDTQYTISVGKTGQGTITSTPTGIDCGTTCEAPFAEGTMVTLTANPTAGYAFKGWTGGCTNTTGPCVLTLNADAEVFASFKPSGYTLNVIKVGSGTVTSVPAGINCGTDCNETYATVGTIVTLTATPATVFAFSKWTGACTGTTPTCKVTMNAAKMVTATFSTLPDFVVTGVTLTPAAPTANSTFTATITVKNQGSVVADGGYLDVWSHSSTIQSCDAEGSEWSRIGSIAAGATKLITITGLRAAKNVGSKTLRAFVDSWCQTAESQEANNQFTKVYTVK